VVTNHDKPVPNTHLKLIQINRAFRAATRLNPWETNITFLKIEDETMIAANSICTRLIFIAFFLASFSVNATSIDYAALYEQVSDSVVTVKTQTIKLEDSGITATPGTGSGILLEPTLVLTAAHVVKQADLISVHFKDGVDIMGKVVATVEQSDTGLIRLAEPHPTAKPVTLGDSDRVKTGSSVFIIGAPYGIEQTLSVGIVSGRMSRGIMEDGTNLEFLQTDTAINPGNSGGPMFNAEGEVVGIVSFIMSTGGGFDGVGFASAINSAHHTVTQSSGFIAGFDGIALTEQVQHALGIGSNALLVQHVVEGSLADKFGLRAGSIPAKIADVSLMLGGDIIVDVSCHQCKVSMNNTRAVAQTIRDESATSITVLREGEKVVLSHQETTSPAATVAAFSPVISGL